MKNKIIYVTEPDSKVYHIISAEKKVPKRRHLWWDTGDISVCGLTFPLYDQYNYRPKGKRLCKNCKRTLNKKDPHK